MYNLIIVDDEQKIRHGIASGIPWNELGFEVAGVCANGLEALQIIEENPPHVVLSDIRMPRMDGLELMQIINQKYPFIKVIILSGYNDFEYLNMSIKNRVIDYLLKPTDVDEFARVFEKLRFQLDMEEEQKREYETLQRLNKEAVWRRKIIECLHGFYLMDDLEFSGQEGSWAVIFIQITEMNENDSISYYSLYENVTRECTLFTEGHSFFQSEFIWNYDEYLIGLVRAEKEEGKEAKLKEYARDLREHLNRKYQIFVIMGVSSFTHDLKELSELYRQAGCCLSQRVFVSQKSQAVFYAELPDNSEEYYTKFLDEEKLFRYVTEQNKQGLEDELKSFFSEFKGKTMKDVGYVDRISLAALHHIEQRMKRYDGPRLEARFTIEYYGEKYKKCDLDGKYQMMLEILNAVSDDYKTAKDKKSGGLASRIKEIIDSEYAENTMSLEYVAEKLKKHPAYISSVFKDELGCKFSDYVIQKRLDKALELLRDQTLKIYEISEMLGWADPSNFIRIFKKKYGISPNEYRNL